MDNSYSDVLSDICIKKNDIVRISINENICIVHDRYWLNNDFFSGFDAFGYDFDFVTVRQNHKSGKEYPSYCAIDSKYNLLIGKIFNCRDDNQSWTNHYLNGGLIIAKRNVIQHIRFNDTIMHNQAEDVELAHCMISQSIVPRINRHSSATTSAPDHLTDDFISADTTDYDDVLFMEDFTQGCNNPTLSDANYFTLIGERGQLFGRPCFKAEHPGAGTLLYGPYSQLSAGDYEISLMYRFHVPDNSLNTGESWSWNLDIVSGIPTTNIYSEDIQGSALSCEGLVTRRIRLDPGVQDLQIRVQVCANTPSLSVTFPTMIKL